MMQSIHLITYGNEMYEKSKKRLLAEATNSQWFDTITICGPETLTMPFKNEFREILNKPRGAGYWIWKFDIIKQQLNKLVYNDILVYTDAGCSINIHGETRFNEYIAILNKSNESIISFQMHHIDKKYTAKQLFCHFNMNVHDDNANSGQFMATIMIMKNTEKMMNIIDECINVLRTDSLLVTDYYNTLGQCDDFIDNRHDQSILSLVRKKCGSIIIPDETYFKPFGNKKSLRFPFWATRKR
tara:strand:+ start:116 stop:841 length:726 start_codon:yes stop_codon:yes gene_type:complete